MTRGESELLAAAAAVVTSAADAADAPGRVVRLLSADRQGWDWVGIYLLDGDTLVLGPFAGEPTEHLRIPVGRGVCGTAVAERRSLVVDDVTTLDNYLACSVHTRSELVVLIEDGDEILGQFDIDSDRPGNFGDADVRLLQRLAPLVAPGCRALRDRLYEAGTATTPRPTMAP